MIKIGDTLILELTYSEKTERYRCKLAEREGDKLFIDYPINLETEKTAFLIDGTQMKGSFVSGDGSVYLFDCEVTGRVKLNIPMMILSYPGDEHLMKIQRRQFVRVETSVDAAVHPGRSEFSPFVSVTEDISAGGAAIIAGNQTSLQQDMTVHIWFVLTMQNGETQYLRLKSKVVRVAALNETKNILSVQFMDITAQDRQLLLRFCFDRQLAMKKKGLEI